MQNKESGTWINKARFIVRFFNSLEEIFGKDRKIGKMS